MDFSHLDGLLSNMFAREAFASRFLESSFQAISGWAELAIVITLMVLTFKGTGIIIQSGRLQKLPVHNLRHVARRITWPVLMLGVGVVAMIVWRLIGFPALWLRLMVLAANWMIMIRLVLSILHIALPEQRWANWLERTASSVLWVYFLLWVSGIDDIIINWMKSLQFTIGSSKLNLFTIATGLLWVGVVMVMMMWLAKWINSKLMGADSMDMNLRIVLSKITTTVLLFLSVLIALPLVGIDLSVLSVFGGALGVGLGFGLQKIASNYVSGFIILADRSIRPGDRLTVNNFTGYVTQITSRFVVLKSATGQEALIPNETFVTSTVINESYTGKALYQSLDVQVAYHTDLALALRILKEAAAEQERVEEGDTPPKSYLINFGENGIDLRVGFWVKDPENGFVGLQSAILLTIWKRFNEEDIDFPYPQREIRILHDEEKPSDMAILKAGIAAKQDTRSDEPSDESDD
ncbi:mechanosensitive ion channel family protein [Neisseriaceae bacterium B1]